MAAARARLRAAPIRVFRRSAAGLIVLGVATAALAAGAAARTGGRADELLAARINAVRATRGARPLVTSPALARAAAAHARSMSKLGYFAHEDRDGTAFSRRITRFYPLGPFRRWRVGEDLYWSPGAATAATIVQAWLHSPPHARVLFDAWRQVGVAVVTARQAPGVFGGRDVTVVVADFGLRVP